MSRNSRRKRRKYHLLHPKHNLLGYGVHDSTYEHDRDGHYNRDIHGYSDWWKRDSGSWWKKQKPWWGEKMTIALSPLAHAKLLYYTRAADGEISGFGKTRKVGRQVIVEDVRIFKQECSSGSTDLSMSALHVFINELIKASGDPSQWKLWWHTHNDFGVFWSTTDTSNMERHSEDSWLVSICANKKGQLLGRIDEKGRESDIPVMMAIEGSEKIKENCEKEVKKLVKKWLWHNKTVYKEKKKETYKGRDIEEEDDEDIDQGDGKITVIGDDGTRRRMTLDDFLAEHDRERKGELIVCDIKGKKA